jgi:hypothetical protein
MTLRTRARRLTDPRSLENGLASSAAMGALTLIDPARLSPGGRLAYRGAMAALAAAGVAIELNADDDDLFLDPTSRVAITVGAAGLILAMAEVSEHWDARLFRYLSERGVPAPRVLMAAGAAAFSLATFELGRLVPRPRAADLGEDLVLRPVPAEVRALVLGMLDAAEGFGADELRAQLESAQVEAPTAGFTSVVEFVVPEDAPRAVPHDFTFPVKAHFRTDGGEEVRALLVVQDGWLSVLILDSVTGEGDLEEDGLVDLDDVDDAGRWPALHEVTFVRDSATP